MKPLEFSQAAKGEDNTNYSNPSSWVRKIKTPVDSMILNFDPSLGIVE